jgi:hypothetical protein
MGAGSVAHHLFLILCTLEQNSLSSYMRLTPVVQISVAGMVWPSVLKFSMLAVGNVFLM